MEERDKAEAVKAWHWAHDSAKRGLSMVYLEGSDKRYLGLKPGVVANRVVVLASAYGWDLKKHPFGGSVRDRTDLVTPDPAIKRRFNPEIVSAQIPGFKLDDGKLQWHLLLQGCMKALTGAVQVLMYGLNKGYPDHNWKKVDAARYKNAAARHFFAYLNGEDIDPESGLPHIDHLLTNILFLSEFHHNKDRT